MRATARNLLVLALVVAIGVVLVAWLGGGLGGAGAPAPGPAASGSSVPAGAEAATVRYVHDGDTLYLTIEGADAELKVRLLGIDTPEVGEHAECYGDVARDRVRELLPEGTVVRVIEDREPLDQYGRTLLHVFLPDGTHLNRLLIDEGLAEAMFFAPNRAYESEFRAAEAGAEAAGVGMWGACGR